jgi:hypothetical protein
MINEISNIISDEKEYHLKLNKNYIQKMGQKYLRAESTKVIKDDYYGNYKTELIAIVKWDKKNFLISDKIYKYIVKNFNGTCVSLKDFNTKSPKDFTEEFEGEIVGIYCATEDSSKDWKSSLSNNKIVQTTYKSKKIPISISEKKLEKFYEIIHTEQTKILEEIEEDFKSEQNKIKNFKDSKNIKITTTENSFQFN